MICTHSVYTRWQFEDSLLTCTRTLSLLSKVLYSLKAKHKIYIYIYAPLNITTSLIPHHSSLLISPHFCYNYAIKSCTMLLLFLAIRQYFHLLEDKSSKRKKIHILHWRRNLRAAQLGEKSNWDFSDKLWDCNLKCCLAKCKNYILCHTYSYHKLITY